MTEQIRGGEPGKTPRERYVEKAFEFAEASHALRAGIERAKQNKDGRTFLELTITKERKTNDFEWMETCKEQGLPEDQVLDLLDKKQGRKKEHTEIAKFLNIVKGLEDPEESAADPLKDKYLQFSDTLRSINEDSSRIKKGEGEYAHLLRLLQTREQVVSDFEWMETCRKEGMSHDKILNLFNKKAERKIAAERAAFDEIIKGSEGSQE